ncbi:MAG: phage portal protein [Anaerostipes sp.]|nr:phage portal protein [Anaerostipes sp.]
MGIFKTFQGKLYNWLDKDVSNADIKTVMADIYQSIQFKEIALYIATSYISNTIGNCEFKVYENGTEVKNELYYWLNVVPNQNQNASQFKNKLVSTYFYNQGALILPKKNKFYVADEFHIEKQAFKDWVFDAVVIDDLSVDSSFKMSKVLYFQLDHQEVKELIDSMYVEYGKLMSCALNYYKKSKGQKYKLIIDSYQAGDADFNKIYTEQISKQLEDFMKSDNAVYPQYEGLNLEDISNNSSYTADDIIKIRKETFEIVAQAFKIPMSMMQGNITNMNEIVKVYLTYCIDPIAKMIGDEFTRKLFDFDEWKNGSKVVVDTSRISHLDMLEVADKADKLVASGVACIDEVRNRLGMNLLNTAFSQKHFITKNYEGLEKALNSQGKEEND